MTHRPFKDTINMILINKGEANNIILTLNEKRTIDNPYYIFKFVNDDTNVSKVFYSADLSDNTDRYNQFTITEGTPENLLTGTVSLPVGFYHYTVYESETITLNLNLVGEVVELGKVKVQETSTTHSFTPTYNTTKSTFTPTI